MIVLVVCIIMYTLVCIYDKLQKRVILQIMEKYTRQNANKQISKGRDLENAKILKSTILSKHITIMNIYISTNSKKFHEAEVTGCTR